MFEKKTATQNTEARFAKCEKNKKAFTAVTTKGPILKFRGKEIRNTRQLILNL